MMHTTKQREQAEPTLLRATPWLGGVNTQQNTVMQSTWTLSKGTSKPGTQSNQWGGIWTSKGTGHLGKGHAARGYQWGQKREIFTTEAPLPWFLERVPVRGVEGVAAGARGCLGYPSAAAYLEASSRGGKKDLHWGAKEERPIGASPDPGATGQGRGGT